MTRGRSLARVLDLLCPDQCVDSVFEIDLAALGRKGIRALILDLDNTLLGWESDRVPDEVRRWVWGLRAQGFKVCIASNGTPARVRAIAGDLGVPGISKAVKPRKKPFRQAMDILGEPPEATAVVGDQIFTDVLGGNRLDLYTILINPVSHQELRTTKMVRRMERRVLARLQKKGKLEEEGLRKRLGG